MSSHRGSRRKTRQETRAADREEQQRVDLWQEEVTARLWGRGSYRIYRRPMLLELFEFPLRMGQEFVKEYGGSESRADRALLDLVRSEELRVRGPLYVFRCCRCDYSCYDCWCEQAYWEAYWAE